jgi:hypothetical protein
MERVLMAPYILRLKRSTCRITKSKALKTIPSTTSTRLCAKDYIINDVHMSVS